MAISRDANVLEKAKNPARHAASSRQNAMRLSVTNLGLAPDARESATVRSGSWALLSGSEVRWTTRCNLSHYPRLAENESGRPRRLALRHVFAMPVAWRVGATGHDKRDRNRKFRPWFPDTCRSRCSSGWRRRRLSFGHCLRDGGSKKVPDKFCTCARVARAFTIARKSSLEPQTRSRSERSRFSSRCRLWQRVTNRD